MKRMLCLALFLVACNSPGGGGGGGSLAGTWELAGATGSAPQGTLTITPTRLTIMLGGDAFDLNLDGTPMFSWSDHSSSAPITMTKTGGGVNGGVLPLSLGGDWSFSGSTGGTCTASVQPASIIASCAGAGASPVVDLNRHATATRTQQLSSIFGDLGGVWSVSDEYNNKCTITLQGSTISGTCGTGGAGISMTFGDGVVSGATDSGAEFSARRQ